MATTKSPTVTSAPGATPAGAFFDIPLSLITVEGRLPEAIDDGGPAVEAPTIKPILA